MYATTSAETVVHNTTRQKVAKTPNIGYYDHKRAIFCGKPCKSSPFHDDRRVFERVEEANHRRLATHFALTGRSAHARLRVVVVVNQQPPDVTVDFTSFHQIKSASAHDMIYAQPRMNHYDEILKW